MKRSTKPSSALSRAPTRGFTLVELIVVIAILGILAGIAIPVYSNYVNKANEAADQQLIGAVNTAFAAACLEHGVDAKDVAGAELAYTAAEDDKTYITGLESVDGLDLTQMNESFKKFFGDNDQTALRYYKEGDIFFNPSPDPQAGTFSANKGTGGRPGIQDITSVDNGDSTTFTLTRTDGTTLEFTVDNDDLEAITNSTFGSMEMGDLMGDVGHVVNAVHEVLNGTSALKKLIGAENLEKYGLTGSDDKTALSNALVLATAEQYAKSGLVIDEYGEAPDAARELMERFMSYKKDREGKNGEDAQNQATGYMAQLVSTDYLRDGGMAEVALAYGMVTAFMNNDNFNKNEVITLKDYDGNTIIVDGEVQKMTLQEYFNYANTQLMNAGGGTEGIENVMTMITNIAGSDSFSGYSGYCSSDDYELDLSGYLASMSAMAGNSSAMAKGSYALSNGFTDEEIVEILRKAFGGSEP